MRLDEPLPRRHLITHQHAKDLISSCGIGNRHLAHDAVDWIHRRFPELLRVHFSQTFVALDDGRSFIPCPLLFDDVIPLTIGVRVKAVFGNRNFVKRRLGDIEMSLLNDVGKMPVEEG